MKQEREEESVGGGGGCHRDQVWPQTRLVLVFSHSLSQARSGQTKYQGQNEKCQSDLETGCYSYR